MMAVAFDENGATVVGNKVMVSGTWTTLGTAEIDASPYMNVIEQIFINPTQQGGTIIVLQGAGGTPYEENTLEIKRPPYVEILTDTTAQIFDYSPVDFTRSTTMSTAGIFLVMGRK
tara:strand:- start:280 stop:627 length:348 start_codon:yes stop_codon:yes gene_type:complete